MKLQSITIEKKKFLIVPEKEYLSLKEDVVDLKKVFARRKENSKQMDSLSCERSNVLVWNADQFIRSTLTK